MCIRDSNKGEHPQMGLEKADIVFVQLDGYPAAVGQSGTRLMPVFHSQYADTVNPVRSIRPVDIPALSPITAIIGNTCLLYTSTYRTTSVDR